MFGSINALFTALAFAGLTYTIVLQRHSLEETTRSQEKLWKEQQDFQDTQRRKQEEAMKDIEKSRQEFLEKAEGFRIKHEHDEECRFKANVLRAIGRELEVLNRIYDEGTGALLKQVGEGDYHKEYFVMSQNFFSVYEANVVNLGRLDAEHARQIIFIYTMLKSLVEELRVNNQYLDAYYEGDDAYGGIGHPHVIAQNQRDRALRLLKNQLSKIKKLEAVLKESTEKLRADLRAGGIV